MQNKRDIFIGIKFGKPVPKVFGSILKDMFRFACLYVLFLILVAVLGYIYIHIILSGYSMNEREIFSVLPALDIEKTGQDIKYIAQWARYIPLLLTCAYFLFFEPVRTLKRVCILCILFFPVFSSSIYASDLIFKDIVVEIFVFSLCVFVPWIFSFFWNVIRCLNSYDLD